MILIAQTLSPFQPHKTWAFVLKPSQKKQTHGIKLWFSSELNSISGLMFCAFVNSLTIRPDDMNVSNFLLIQPSHKNICVYTIQKLWLNKFKCMIITRANLFFFPCSLIFAVGRTILNLKEIFLIHTKQAKKAYTYLLNHFNGTALSLKRRIVYILL